MWHGGRMWDLYVENGVSHSLACLNSTNSLLNTFQGLNHPISKFPFSTPHSMWFGVKVTQPPSWPLVVCFPAHYPPCFTLISPVFKILVNLFKFAHSHIFYYNHIKFHICMPGFYIYLQFTQYFLIYACIK